MEEKKILFGRMNSDSGEYSLPREDFLNAINIDIFTPTGNDAGEVRGAQGNTLVAASADWGISGWKTIGACEDPGNNRILFIIAPPNSQFFSFVLAYDKSVDDMYIVYNLGQFVNGGKITYVSSDLIHSMVVKGDYLIWASDGKPVYKLNIDRNIKRWHSDYYKDVVPAPFFRDPKEIELAKAAPKLSPYLDFEWVSTDDDKYYKEKFWLSGTKANYLGSNSYLFATRFIYEDGDISTRSPWSRVVQPPSGTKYNGIRVYYVDPNYNSIDPPPDVKYVELLVKYGNTGEAYIIDKITRDQYANFAFDFYNNEIGEALSDDYIAKDFESVPLVSGVVESVKNRIALGYNTEGYDTPASTTLSLGTYYMGGDAEAGDWFSSFDFTPSLDNTFILENFRIWGARSLNDEPYFGYSSQYVCVYLGTFNVQLAGYYIVPEIKVSSFQSSNNDKEYLYYIDSNTWNTWRGSASYNTMIYVGRTMQDVVSASTYSNSFYKQDEYYERRKFKTPQQFGSLNLTQMTISDFPEFLFGTVRSGDVLFKSGANYNFGVLYKDNKNRKCAVITNDDLRIDTPLPMYNMLVSDGKHTDRYLRQVTWDLSGETPPSWAESFHIVRTKPNTRSFFQFLTEDVMYAYKDGDEGNSVTVYETEGYYDVGRNMIIKEKLGEWNVVYGNKEKFVSAIAIPLGQLNAKNIGYTYTEGDYVRVTRQDLGIQFTTKIKEVVGGWIIAEYVDLGDIPTDTNRFIILLGGDNEPPVVKARDTKRVIPWSFQVEIISPAATASGVYSEISEEYPIIDGVLQKTSGIIRGDVYISKDDREYREVMNRGNDHFSWETDAMTPNFSSDLVEDSGEVSKPTSLRWSGNLIAGTKVNNLSSFDALDEEILSTDIGSIQSLVFTSKVSDYGNVLLVIGEGESLSIYIEENILTDTEGNENVQQTTKFVGTVRELKGSYGTVHPESVAEHKGKVYWWDAGHKEVIRYSNAGLHSISDVGMRSFFKSLDTDSIRMYGGFNSLAEEYWLCVPSVNSEYIEYPSDWTGNTPCEDNTQVLYGDGFAGKWASFLCTQTDSGFVATWGNFLCTQEDVTVDPTTGAVWASFICAQQDSSSVFDVSWGSFLCTLSDEVFNASWSSFICAQVNDEGTFTAEWQEKICVNVTE